MSGIRTWVVLLSVLDWACSSTATPTTSTSLTAPAPQSTGSATAADLTFCVTETNRHRATVGKPNFTQSAALEAFATDGARIDHAAALPHTHFNSLNGGGVAAAENELHRFLFSSFGTVQVAITQMIASFWAEGSSGEHYQIIAGPYQQLGCVCTSAAMEASRSSRTFDNARACEVLNL